MAFFGLGFLVTMLMQGLNLNNISYEYKAALQMLIVVGPSLVSAWAATATLPVRLVTRRGDNTWFIPFIAAGCYLIVFGIPFVFGYILGETIEFSASALFTVLARLAVVIIGAALGLSYASHQLKEELENSLYCPDCRGLMASKQLHEFPINSTSAIISAHGAWDLQSLKQLAAKLPAFSCTALWMRVCPGCADYYLELFTNQSQTKIGEKTLVFSAKLEPTHAGAILGMFPAGPMDGARSPVAV